MGQIAQERTGLQPGLRGRQPFFSSRLLLWLLIGLFLALALAPFLFAGLLYTLSWRAEVILGHWPRAWVDDPFYSVTGDWLYDLLLRAVIVFGYAIAIGLVAVPLTIIPALALWRRHPRLWLWSLILIAIYFIGLFVIQTNPGDRLRWFMD
jgi:hypothetical protein